jgi:hypothetical protein
MPPSENWKHFSGLITIAKIGIPDFGEFQYQPNHVARQKFAKRAAWNWTAWRLAYFRLLVLYAGVALINSIFDGDDYEG